MGKLRYLIRLIFAYINRFKGIILIGIFVGVMLFLTTKVLVPSFFRGKTQKIGIAGRYHTDKLPTEILKLVSDGLTRVNESGMAEPALAESWETSDKGKTWTFHLKKDSFWQDKTPVTSQTIVYEFSDVEIERPDSLTITFKLKNPYSPFPTVVSKPTFRKGLLGTGEWKVKNVTLNGGFVQELVLSNQGDTKIFRFYPTTESLKLALKLGKIDKILNVLDPSPFQGWNTLTTEAVPNRNQVVTVFFNTEDSLLSEKTFRQALFYAIDKDALGDRALGPISPFSWAYNPQVKSYTYDVERARQLLEDLPNEFKGKAEIRLVSAPSLLSTAEKIAKDWEEIGVKTVVQVSSIIPNEFSAYLTIFDSPIDPDQYPMWHSTQTETNISKYSNPRIDKLLEDGRVELNLEERKKIYLDFQRFLLEDVPAAFLYHPTYYTITRK